MVTESGGRVNMNPENVKKQIRRLRVLLADDHQLILDGVRRALD
jgi:hypothetical protein